MDKTGKTISVIIPTHNRQQSVKRLLDVLQLQSYPSYLIEIIVIADGCNDSTVSMLKAYKSSVVFNFIEQPGQGAAVARNKGAMLAKNELLLFLDDDIDPSPSLIEAHVAAHAIPNRVVIGYLPLLLKDHTFFHKELWTWWEEKYQMMRQSGYRFSYEDLLSGNFSLSAKLFKSIHGFNAALRCREDYELGIRLVKEEVEFVFAADAWGYHKDEVTNLERSYKRKRQEGKADICLGNIHPDIISTLFISYIGNSHSFSKTVLYFFLFNAPIITDIQAKALQYLINRAEWLKMRSLWRKMNYVIKDYWYLRGAAEVLRTRDALSKFLRLGKLQANEKTIDIELDLQQGLAKAEHKLNLIRPSSMHLTYGDQSIGYILKRAGAEKLRGVHLRPILATTLAWPFMQAMAVQEKVNNDFPKE